MRVQCLIAYGLSLWFVEDGHIKKSAGTRGVDRRVGVKYKLSGRRLHDDFCSLVTLALDEETVCGVLYAHALEVEVFDGSVLVNVDVSDG